MSEVETSMKGTTASTVGKRKLHRLVRHVPFKAVWHFATKRERDKFIEETKFIESGLVVIPRDFFKV